MWVFRPHYGPEIDSASNRNEYQQYLLGGKGGRCIELTTLPPSCADCLEILGASTSWSPKGLSRPVMRLLDLINVDSNVIFIYFFFYKQRNT
jgi:hypothetical protein